MLAAEAAPVPVLVKIGLVVQYREVQIRRLQSYSNAWSLGDVMMMWNCYRYRYLGKDSSFYQERFRHGPQRLVRCRHGRSCGTFLCYG